MKMYEMRCSIATVKKSFLSNVFGKNVKGTVATFE